MDPWNHENLTTMKTCNVVPSHSIFQTCSQTPCLLPCWSFLKLSSCYMKQLRSMPSCVMRRSWQRAMLWGVQQTLGKLYGGTPATWFPVAMVLSRVQVRDLCSEHDSDFRDFSDCRPYFQLSSHQCQEYTLLYSVQHQAGVSICASMLTPIAFKLSGHLVYRTQSRKILAFSQTDDSFSWPSSC